MKELPIQAILKRCQIWKACNKPGEDKVRPVLEYVYFENGYAYASNAHILVRIPIVYITTLDDDSNNLLNGHGIHGPLMKYLADLWPLKVQKEIVVGEDGKETEYVSIIAWHGENEVKVTLTNPEQVKHPNFDPLFSTSGERIPVKKIGISQNLLNKLTAAIGTSEIKMGFVDERRQIFISPITSELEGIEGIIMPIMVTGTLNGFE